MLSKWERERIGKSKQPKRLTDKDKEDIRYHASIRGIGDCATARTAGMDQIVETQEEAQEIVDLVCETVGWPRWTVTFSGRRTEKRRATAWPSERRMRVNVIGQTVGTILHELAHERGCCHDDEFKRTQAHLIWVWLG